MKRIAGILVLVTVLAACQKEQKSEVLSVSAAKEGLSGRYIGTFTRNGKNPSNVSILFRNDNTYEGSSSDPRYPAICSGTFIQEGSTLTVNDTCTWTADFDWTLIFDGTYSIEYRDENSVRIWRTNGSITDEYVIGLMSR